MKNLSASLVWFLCLIFLTSTYKTMEIGNWFGCPGRLLPMRSCQSSSTMNISSITVYATDNTSALQLADSLQCHLIYGSINRTIHSTNDQGLSLGYDYLHRLIKHKCNGLKECEVVRLPEWSKLSGHFLASESNEKRHRYFAGVLIHAQCYRTTLAIIIMLSAMLPLITLVLLYNWSRYRRKRRVASILADMGRPDMRRPDEEHSWFEEGLFRELKPDVYSSNKPDEILTLDKRSMREGKLYVEEDTISEYSHNSCSTIGRNRNKCLTAYDNKLFQYTRAAVNDQYTGAVNDQNSVMSRLPSIILTPPVNYDTVENIELETRMADTMGQEKENQSNQFGSASDKDDVHDQVLVAELKHDKNQQERASILKEKSTTVWRVEARFTDITSHSMPKSRRSCIMEPVVYTCEMRKVPDPRMEIKQPGKDNWALV
ncbi:uncharacterized protein [Watersipora subatra]|uniref:uncharacterized protein isoform X2 n=1 Tax=Watersipora subatra TaxID=2589382 RepID=UPI00355BA6EE